MDALSGGFNFAQRALNKALAAKAGVDAHDQNQVNVVHHPVQHIQRLGGVEHQAHLAARAFYGLNAAVHMARGIGVKADEVGPRLGKGVGQGVHRLHHEVHIYGYGRAVGPLGMGTQGLAHHGTKR